VNPTARHSAPETKPILRFKGVSIRFGGVQTLDEVDFEVGAGEVHCLAGENECGKSTIIKVIAGVYQPDSNTVMACFLGGVDPFGGFGRVVSVLLALVILQG
jgi:ABC-type multidrug transport system ATPase subunit